MSGWYSCSSKWDPKEVPHRLPGEHSDPGLGRPGIRESQLRCHHGEWNYSEPREPVDATILLDGETAMSPGLDDWMREIRGPSSERSLGRSFRPFSRSRSRSPERGFNRAGFSDKSTGDQPCKEDIVDGRSCSGDFSLHIHRNHKDAKGRIYLESVPKDGRESSHVRTDASKYLNRDDTSRARESYHTLPHQTNVIPCKFFAAGNCRKGKLCYFSHQYDRHETLNRSVLEKRAIGSSLDDNPASVSRSMVHQMDGCRARKNNKRDYVTLTSDCTGSKMVVSESRGEAVQGVDGLDHSTQPLKSLFQEDGSSQTSAMSTMSTEQLADLVCSLSQLLASGIQLLQQNAAPNARNTLCFMQASLPSSAAPNARNMQASVPSSGTPEPSGAGLCTTERKNVDLDTSSHQFSTKDEFVDCKSEMNNGMKVEEKKGQDSGDIEKNEGDGKAGEKKKNNDEKSLRAFKLALAEFVKVLLQPTWKEGQLNKEAYKTIVKKVVEKVTSSIKGIEIPQSRAQIGSYLSFSKPKLSRFVQAYVEKVKKEKANLA